MQLFYQPEIPRNIFYLDTEESRHATKVLRLQVEDTIHLTDGKGTFYQAKITDPNPRKCTFQITTTDKTQPHPSYRHIAIAPTKNIDRTEWFVEKAVEFGIDRLSFIICDHSERKIIKRDRLVKKAVSAMKQSLKAYLPQIDEAVPFKKFIDEASADQKCIAYVDNANENYLIQYLSNRSNLVLIGPEGDFSSKEVQIALTNGFQKISLGKSRLRTETAGVAVAHLLNLA